jgi:hypothetical protein
VLNGVTGNRNFKMAASKQEVIASQVVDKIIQNNFNGYIPVFARPARSLHDATV